MPSRFSKIAVCVTAIVSVAGCGASGASTSGWSKSARNTSCSDWAKRLTSHERDRMGAAMVSGQVGQAAVSTPNSLRLSRDVSTVCSRPGWTTSTVAQVFVRLVEARGSPAAVRLG